MISEFELWRSANLLIRQFGRDASITAFEWACTAEANGDCKGYQKWIDVCQTVNEMERDTPHEWERVH